jgi:hypothetical protein
MIRAALLSIIATACHAGDSTTPGPLELLTPFVIEVQDLGPLERRFTDEQLFAFLDEDAPLPVPVPVPIPAGLWLLAGALLALRVVKHG